MSDVRTAAHLSHAESADVPGAAGAAQPSALPIFDARTHRYRLGLRWVPSVTQILAPLCDFRGVPVPVLRAAAAFGTAVHRACELDDLGRLDEARLDAALAPYLHAWRSFCREHRARWRLVEAPLYHASMGYCGTVDRYGLLGDEEVVVDLKTTSRLYPSVGPQLAAYHNAIERCSPHTRRLAVRLQASGRYEVREYCSAQDWAVFASLLTLRTFCQQHGVTPNFERSFHER